MKPEYVEKWYDFDSVHETILFTDQLRNGMRVLVSDGSMREDIPNVPPSEKLLARVNKFNRWCVVSNHSTSGERSRFVGIYDNDDKRAHDHLNNEGWFVKLDSIPPEPAYVPVEMMNDLGERDYGKIFVDPNISPESEAAIREWANVNGYEFIPVKDHPAMIRVKNPLMAEAHRRLNELIAQSSESNTSPFESFSEAQGFPINEIHNLTDHFERMFGDERRRIDLISCLLARHGLDPRDVTKNDHLHLDRLFENGLNYASYEITLESGRVLSSEEIRNSTNISERYKAIGDVYEGDDPFDEVDEKFIYNVLLSNAYEEGQIFNLPSGLEISMPAPVTGWR